MIISDARRAANRQNAIQSTGPKTAEGKEVARRNALKHGLTALVVDPQDEGDGQARVAEFRSALRPSNEWQAWLVAAITQLTTRLDRAARIERRLRAEGSWRALTFWDEDQRLEAERLGETLARHPALVIAELARSPQGCDWLIERWAMLARAADLHPWTSDQAALANHLLGTPVQVHDEASTQVIDMYGRAVLPVRPEAEVARAMIAELAALRERVAEADEIARSLARADLNDAGTADLKRLRRYERDLARRLQWCVEQFHAAAPASPSVRPIRSPGLSPLDSPPASEPDAAVVPGRNEPTPPDSGDETNPFLPPVDLPAPPAMAASAPHPAPEMPRWSRSDPSKRRPDLKKLAARGWR